jgi:hypothetical protein
MESDERLQWYWYLLILIFIGAWIYFRGEWGSLLVNNKADFYFATIVILGLLIYSVQNMGKYQTPQFVCNGIHGSVNIEDAIKIRPFVIIGLGAIKAFGLFFRGKERTCIVPSHSLRIVGNRAFSWARVKRVSLNDVPPKIKLYLESTNLFNTNKIYLGYASEEYEAFDQEYTDLELEEIHRNSLLNKLQDYFKDSLGIDEALVSSLGRIFKSKKKSKIEAYYKEKEKQEKRPEQPE